MWRSASKYAILAALLAAPATPHVLARGAVGASRVAGRAAPARARPLAASRERDGNEVPRKLLLQSSIQAQLSYAMEFKNELMGRWLESFLGHEHLRATRTGDMTSTIKFRGLDGLRCDWQDYLRTMLSSGPQEYTVRYRVGTPDLLPRKNGEASATATADGAEAPWAAASASRRNNPYLKNQGPAYREYTETIEPRRVARGLMQIRSQLSDEWLHDLPIIAADGARIKAWLCSEEESKRRAAEGEAGPELCAVGPGEGQGADPADAPGFGASGTSAADGMAEAAAALEVEELSSDGRPKVPLPVAATFAEATRSWSGSSTPFRALNYDMLQRALMREATLRTLRELERDEGAGSSSKHATVAWLRERFEAWRPLLETCALRPRARGPGARRLAPDPAPPAALSAFTRRTRAARRARPLAGLRRGSRALGTWSS